MAEILQIRRKTLSNQSTNFPDSLLINKAFSDVTLTNRQLKYKFILHERESKSPSLHLMCTIALLYSTIASFYFTIAMVYYTIITLCTVILECYILYYCNILMSHCIVFFTNTFNLIYCTLAMFYCKFILL